MANVLSIGQKTAVITALVEGCSIRSTSRMTGVAKSTILLLLEEVGTACAEHQDRVICNVKANRVQVDEIWSFVGAKANNTKPANFENGGYAGDAWTFVAIDADSKLVISWLTGRRDAGYAADFLQDVASRLSNRVQLTSDGHKMYLDAVPDAFGEDVDSRSWSRSTGTLLRDRNATARRCVWELNTLMSSAILTMPTSRPARWSARTSPCACLCAASPA